MVFDCELRFRDIVKKTSKYTGNDYFLVSFLDDRDNKYFFFYDLEDGKQFLNIGPSCDIYTNSSKQFAFENGIRSMKPDVIVTDEINLESDLFAIRQAISSGVSVIATIHANSVYDLKMKPRFDNMIKDKVFDRYIVLSSSNGPGTLEGVFNENLVCVGN